mgnify:CR=1 FL=1
MKYKLKQNRIVIFTNYFFSALNFLVAGIIGLPTNRGLALCWIQVAIGIAGVGTVTIFETEEDRINKTAVISMYCLQVMLCGFLSVVVSPWWIAVYVVETIGLWGTKYLIKKKNHKNAK